MDILAIIQIIINIVLVIITAIYVIYTRNLVVLTLKQYNMSSNPVIGIKIKEITISKLFDNGRRNMSIQVELMNIGNGPALDIFIDSEIQYRYTDIKGHVKIPSRFEPAIIPFLKSGESYSGLDIYPCFGNQSVIHFFDDYRESSRLNLHRIETKPYETPYNCSILKIFIYYRNNLEQYFESIYTTEISLFNVEPGNDELKVSQIFIPRPRFHAGEASKKMINFEIEKRNQIRDLSGW